MTALEIIYNWTSLLTITALLLIILLWIKENKKLPPGPWNLPIVGYLPFIDAKRPYISLTELSKTYGPIYHIKLGCVSTIVVCDPAIIKEALSRNVFTARANLYLTHGIMGGHGIIAAEGERWKDQRKFVLNTLRSLGMVKSKEKRSIMEERILVGVGKAISDLSKNIDKAVNTQEILLDSLGNVVNSLVLGTTWSNDHPEWIDLKNLIEVGVKLIGIAGPVNFLPFLRWIPKYRRRIEYIFNGMERTHSLYRKLFEQRAEEEDNIMSLFKKEMQSGTNENYNMKQMYHVVADLCGAGTDTTMATLRWFLLYMAIHTRVQDKVQEELDRVMKDRDEPCLDDLQYLPYTEACIKEAQRIRSIVPLGIPHGTYEDTELYGYKVPKDTMILPLQWAVHMNPDVWIDPDQFIPERFLDEDNKASNKHTHFIPFQNGKRMCVGDELGRMLLFLFSTGILKKFKISLGGDYDSEALTSILEGICGITLEPGHHRLKFSHRTPTVNQ